MLIVGAGASVLCVAALVMVATGLVGGPNSPFSLLSPHSAASSPASGAHSHGSHRGDPPSRSGSTGVPGSGQPSSPGTSPSPKADPSPSPTSSASPSASPSSSRTPPGRSNSPSHSPKQ